MLRQQVLRNAKSFSFISINPRVVFIPQIPPSLPLVREQVHKLLVRNVSSSLARHGDDPKPAKKKPRKKIRPTRTSHGRIALEAELSQQNQHITVQSLPGQIERVTANCVAQEFDMNAVNRILYDRGMHAGSSGTLLYPDEPQVIHVEMPLSAAKGDISHITTLEGAPTGDVFIFPSGTVVSWGVPQSNIDYLVSDVLPSAMKGPLGDNAEDEDLEYIENKNDEKSSIRGETIVLGTKPEADGIQDESRHRSMRVVLAKIAFSSGLARATKLAVLENFVDEYSQSSRSILSILIDGPLTRIKSRRWVYQRLGGLLDLRAQLNLYSELADALPDLFWDTKQELGLENYYEQVGKALDVVQRIRILNQKMDYAEEIIRNLRDMRSEIHSSRLEWIIIWLIFFEVVYTLYNEVWRIPAVKKGAKEDHIISEHND
jgi:required for meiotic nuclear division protein 1